MCYDQAEMYSNQQQKAEFLQSVMGKGILLLSLSMIKYSWYTVMKQVLNIYILHIIVYTALILTLHRTARGWTGSLPPRPR